MKDFWLLREMRYNSVGRRCQMVANEKSKIWKVALWKALDVYNRALGGEITETPNVLIRGPSLLTGLGAAFPANTPLHSLQSKWFCFSGLLRNKTRFILSPSGEFICSDFCLNLLNPWSSSLHVDSRSQLTSCLLCAEWALFEYIWLLGRWQDSHH